MTRICKPISCSANLSHPSLIYTSLCRPNQYSHQFLVTHVRLAGFTNKCEEYIAKGLIVDNFFPENMIDEEAFMLLDEASLKEMVPAVGPRKKFMKKLEEEKVF